MQSPQLLLGGFLAARLLSRILFLGLFLGGFLLDAVMVMDVNMHVMLSAGLGGLAFHDKRFSVLWRQTPGAPQTCRQSVHPHEKRMYCAAFAFLVSNSLSVSNIGLSRHMNRSP